MRYPYKPRCRRTGFPEGREGSSLPFRSGEKAGRFFPLRLFSRKGVRPCSPGAVFEHRRERSFQAECSGDARCSHVKRFLQAKGCFERDAPERDKPMIQENVKRILNELPPDVMLVGAAKTRTPAEVLDAVSAGLAIVGENYVQEAERAREAVGERVKWHLIGHLQSNKAKKAVKLFDMIETLDSLNLAQAVDRAAEKEGKLMPVLIEINSGEEPQKHGVLPGEALELIQGLADFPHIRVMGLMTMGPLLDDPESLRPYFRRTRELFEQIRSLSLPHVEMRYLSMGMSDSYRVAIEEGANLVRIGTALFGERPSCNKP